jgi:hypothetical protein
MTESIRMDRINHSLVIGGTGMLSEAALTLGEHSDALSIVARTRKSLDSLGSRLLDSPAVYNPIQIDYQDSASLEKALRAAIESYGLIDLVVAWIHSNAPDVPLIVASIAAEKSLAVDFFHVLGSSSADPKSVLNPIELRLREIPALIYHKIILGFVIEGRDSRWLTNQEISRGVIDAVSADTPEHVVGVVRPWSMRP